MHCNVLKLSVWRLPQLQTLKSLLLASSILLVNLVHAATPVTVVASTQQQQLLKSVDPQLAANKQLVFDFWREVIEAGHLDKAERYLAAHYIQHNPNIADGRESFVEYFATFTKENTIQPIIQQPLVNIIAEGSFVTLMFVQTLPDKTKPGHTYTTTAFDTFRIEQGKIVEHWDSMRKQ